MNSQKIESLRQLLSTFTLMDDFACTQVCRSVLKSENKDLLDVVLEYVPSERQGAMTREQLYGIFLFCACEMDHLDGIKQVLHASKKPLVLHPNFYFGVQYCSLPALALITPCCTPDSLKEMLVSFCVSPVASPDKVRHLYDLLGLASVQEVLSDPVFLEEERKKQNPQHFIFKPNKKRGTSRENLDKKFKKAVNKKRRPSCAKNVNKIQNQR